MATVMAGLVAAEASGPKVSVRGLSVAELVKFASVAETCSKRRSVPPLVLLAPSP